VTKSWHRSRVHAGVPTGPYVPRMLASGKRVQNRRMRGAALLRFLLWVAILLIGSLLVFKMLYQSRGRKTIPPSPPPALTLVIDGPVYLPINVRRG
jgi:hypothetical protein